MTPEWYDTMMFVIRMFGRVGFIVLLVQLYRLYIIFASPALRKKSRTFVRIFTSAVVISFGLMVSEAFTHAEWLPILTMGFNMVITYVLVFYLSGQLRRIEKYKATSEYTAMVTAMDEFIERLKESRL